MPSQQMLVSWLGLLAQTGASYLLLLFFVLLRPYASRRRWFQVWSLAWVALAVALTALLVRYRLPGDPGLAARALQAVYQLGKLAHAGLLAAGTVLLVRGLLPARATRAAAAALAVYGLATGLAPALDLVVLAQAPVMILAAGFSALALGRLAPARQSLGTRTTAVVLATMASRWGLYLFAFAQAVAAGDVLPGGPLQVFARANGYLDLLVAILLAFGMIVVLLEEAHREIDDAYRQLEVAFTRLRSESLYDALTGCLNRRALEERVGLEGVGADFGAVAVLDLDNLKRVNDRWGHHAGDRLLQHLAAVLRHGVRPTDRLYRLGGDEFLLLLRRGRAERVRPRLRELLAAGAIVVDDGGGPRLQLEVSLGCADYDRSEDLERAIATADAAMYGEKQARKSALADVEPDRRTG